MKNWFINKKFRIAFKFKWVILIIVLFSTLFVRCAGCEEDHLWNKGEKEMPKVYLGQSGGGGGPGHMYLLFHKPLQHIWHSVEANAEDYFGEQGKLTGPNIDGEDPGVIKEPRNVNEWDRDNIDNPFIPDNNVNYTYDAYIEWGEAFYEMVWDEAMRFNHPNGNKIDDDKRVDFCDDPAKLWPGKIGVGNCISYVSTVLHHLNLKDPDENRAVRRGWGIDVYYKRLDDGSWEHY